MLIGWQRILESHYGEWEDVGYEQLIEELELDEAFDYVPYQTKTKVKKEPPFRRFRRSADYKRTYEEKILPHEALRKKLRVFMDEKRADPKKKISKEEEPFAAGAPIGKTIPGIWKTKMTYDLSLVYRVAGDVVYLYGFYTHDELGTDGSIPQQQKMAKRFKDMTFESARRLRDRLGIVFLSS